MIVNDKIYGEQQIDDKLVVDIINTKAMQRLKGINQYSTCMFLSPKFDTTRFEHCVGVYLLLKKLGAPYEEQIAGLIHDIAHTAFSHVIDFVYGRGHIQDIHEDFHEEIIKKSKIPLILKRYGMDVNYILNEKNFPLLEKDIPDLCADRMDYFIRDSFTTGLIDSKKVSEYINALTAFDGEVVIKNQDLAKEMAENYMKMNLDFWGSRFVAGSFSVAANTLKLALKNKIISEKDFFLTDNDVLEKLESSNNRRILENLKLIKKDSNFLEGTPENHDLFETTKARFIDPKFLSSRKLVRLSDTDSEFKKRIEDFKKIYEKGFYIRLVR